MYGAEAVILHMSRALKEGSNRSVLGVFLNASNPNLQLHEAALKDGTESHPIPCKGRLDWTAIRSIRELAADADVVHAHGYKADIHVYLAMRKSGTPMVSTCHTWYDHDRKDRFFGTVDRLILRRYAGVVAVSESVRERLVRAGVPSQNISIIRNGIDLRMFGQTSATLKDELGWNSCLLVGLVGRLAAEKGVDIFLIAAASVLQKLPATKFVVVGDGPDRNALETLIDELGIRQSVRLLGRRDDMPAVYASFDLMISSSRREGLPMAILEGMASRRPLIATPVGAVPSVVLDGRTGVLVPAEDPARLAAEIVELLHDKPRREHLAASARLLVEQQFSAQRMTADYLRVYETAIASRFRGHSKKASVDTQGISG